MSGASTEEAVRSAVPVADLSALDAALEANDEAKLKAAIKKLRPADIGRDLSRRPIEQGRRIIEACDERRASAILRAAHPAVAGRLVATCEPHVGAKALAFLPLDREVAILGTLNAEERKRIESATGEGPKKQLDRILAHPENAVARLMTTKVWRCEADKTAAQALEILRAENEAIEVAQNLYVTRGDKLIGVCALRAVALAAPATTIESMMTKDVIALNEDTERSDAAEIIQTHEFLSLPVIDKDGCLVGAVRVDDVLDAALAKVGVGVLNQGGVTGSIAGQLPYFQTPLHRVVRSRITWLVLLFVAETATGTVLRHFEDELAKVVALSFFIPLLIGTGGNAGSQTVSTVIRALAIGEVRLRDVFRVLLKEVSTGLLLGILLGGIALVRAHFWGAGWDLALCVGVTVLVVCTWANTVGAVIPIAAQKLGIDPTVVSAPLITTLVDASGLFIYLTIAHVMIAQLH